MSCLIGRYTFAYDKNIKHAVVLLSERGISCWAEADWFETRKEHVDFLSETDSHLASFHNQVVVFGNQFQFASYLFQWNRCNDISL